MEFLQQWLNTSVTGELVYTALMSMVPIVELRGGLPFGVALGLTPIQAFLASVVGNMIPVPFIILFIRRIFQWMRKHSRKLEGVVDWLERKAHLKGQTVTKYRYLGLFVLVAIPLPGTGAWTGALVAALLNMRIKKAVPSILLGVLAAGVIVLCVTYGVTALL